MPITMLSWLTQTRNPRRAARVPGLR